MMMQILSKIRFFHVVPRRTFVNERKCNLLRHQRKPLPLMVKRGCRYVFCTLKIAALDVVFEVTVQIYAVICERRVIFP